MSIDVCKDDSGSLSSTYMGYLRAVSAVNAAMRSKLPHLTIHTAPFDKSMALNCLGGRPMAVHSMERSRLLCVMTRWVEPGYDSMSAETQKATNNTMVTWESRMV